MIRIRFFGDGELIQSGFSAAQCTRSINTVHLSMDCIYYDVLNPASVSALHVLCELFSCLPLGSVTFLQKKRIFGCMMSLPSSNKTSFFAVEGELHLSLRRAKILAFLLDDAQLATRLFGAELSCSRTYQKKFVNFSIKKTYVMEFPLFSELSEWSVPDVASPLTNRQSW